MRLSAFCFTFLLSLAPVWSQENVVPCYEDETVIQPFECWIKNIFLPVTNTNYSVSYPYASETERVWIWQSLMEVINNAYCQAFPKLRWFDGKDAGVELITTGAFHNCPELQFVFLDRNNLKTLSPDMIRNSPKIRSFHLGENLLTTLPVDLIQNAPSMWMLALEQNLLTTLDPEMFKNSVQLEHLSFESNDIISIDENKMSAYLPKLQYLNFDDNLFPCSRIQAMADVFLARNIFVRVILTPPRERVYTINKVGRWRCVQQFYPS